MTTSTPLPAADYSATSAVNGTTAAGSGDSKSALAAYWANSDPSASPGGDAARPPAAAPSFDQWLSAGSSAPASASRPSVPDHGRARAKANLAPGGPNGAAPLASPAAPAATGPSDLSPKSASWSAAALKHLAAQVTPTPEAAAAAVPTSPVPVIPAIAAAGLLTPKAGLPEDLVADASGAGLVPAAPARVGEGDPKRRPASLASSAAGVTAGNGAKGNEAAAGSSSPRVLDPAATEASETETATPGLPQPSAAGGLGSVPIAADLAKGLARGPTPATASGPEKIAAIPGSAAFGGSAGGSARDKNLLQAKGKEDTEQDSPVGMPGAKSEATMSAPAFAHPHFAQLDSSFGVAAPGASGDRLSGASTASPAAISTAREAVNTVIKLADAQASQAANGVHSVSIGIKFGDTTLGVRVEMRGSEVHTQFNTDSPELQAALAGEWGNLTQDNANRSYHFSDPVFAAANGNSADLSSGTGGGATGQDDAPQFSSARSAFAASMPVSAPASDASASAPTAATVLTARHLSTFA